MTEAQFKLAGIRKTEEKIPVKKRKWYQGKPVVSIVMLSMMILGCLFAEWIMTKDPLYMDLLHYNQAPNK